LSGMGQPLIDKDLVERGVTVGRADGLTAPGVMWAGCAVGACQCERSAESGPVEHNQGAIVMKAKPLRLWQ
jgi:hypothetical protein